MKAGNPLAGCLRFIKFHFFSRRNPSLPYGCTATKRIFDDSAHFYLFRNAKKAQTEKVKGKCFKLTKTFMKTKTFTNINFNEGRQSAWRVACVLSYSLFLSPKSVSAVQLYGDETDIRRLCAFQAEEGKPQASLPQLRQQAVIDFLSSVKDILSSGLCCFPQM